MVHYFSHSSAYFNVILISGFRIQIFQGKSQNINFIKGSCTKSNYTKSIWCQNFSNVRGLLHFINSENLKSSQIANSQISSFQDILLEFSQHSSYSYLTSEEPQNQLNTYKTRYSSKAIFFPKTFYLFQDNHLHFYLFPGCCFYLSWLYGGIIYTQQDAHILVDSWVSFDKYLHVCNLIKVKI